MKKFTLLLMSLLMVSIFAVAQKKLCVHTIYGEKIEYIASDVAYIDFEDVTTEPDDDPVVPESGSFVAKPFSVSATKTVTFSPGNLQYHPANDEWRFALSQLEYIGNDNANISDTYNGWIDLFGWGTGNNPTNTSKDNGDYQTFVDWGSNQIGSYAPNTWRTLTRDEWNYIRNSRTNAHNLAGIAQVNGVNGLILLPDNWFGPEDVIFKAGDDDDTSSCMECYATYQTFTADQWSKLEATGAIFLPAAGRRYGESYIFDLQTCGIYHSAEAENSGEDVFVLVFDPDRTNIYARRCHYAYSVRLVKDL